MTTMSAALGASIIAHALHTVMVLAGLWGLAAVLLPHLLTHLLAGARPTPPPPYDEHDRRVAALRAALEQGRAGTTLTAPRPVTTAPPTRPTRPARPVGPWSVPLAVVATATAAGIHAAVAPPHLREEAAAGMFFLAVSLLQLGWSLAATRRPTDSLLRAGIGLQLALVALWAVTRTVGLPLGLAPEAHPVGPWDLACVTWQLLAVAACAGSLRERARHDRRDAPRTPGWFEWHPSSRAAVGAAACTLVLLTLSGAHS